MVVKADDPQPPLDQKLYRRANETINALLPLRTDSLSQAFWRLADFAGTTAQNETIVPANPPWLADAPPPIRPALAILWGGILHAQTKVTLALANLNETQRTQFLELIVPASIASKNLSSGHGAPGDQARVDDFRSLMALVRFDYLAQAELALIRSTEQAQPLLENLPYMEPKLGPICGPPGGVIFEVVVTGSGGDVCDLIFGGTTNDVYTTSMALLIDSGGDDTYRNNAGGASSLGSPLTPVFPTAILIDLQSGNDTYDADTQAPRAQQGAGCLGAGLLVDQGGSDTYQSRLNIPCKTDQTAIPPEGVVAQGAAILGAGVLADQCRQPGNCNDDYHSKRYSQGSSIGGFALLMDDAGADHYSIDYFNPTGGSEGAQASAAGGFGALVDRGTGPGPGNSDSYDAWVDDMQAHAEIAGVAVLFEEDGDENYVIHSDIGQFQTVNQTLSGWSQGHGEFGGTGILLDLRGNDRYVVEVLNPAAPLPHEGTSSQGIGLAGTGMLLDRSGNDTYSSRISSQGVGLGGTGILYDALDADSYVASVQCQGWAFGGEAGLLDLGEEADTYACNEPAFDCATLMPVQRGDNRVWCSGALGIGRDGPLPP